MGWSSVQLQKRYHHGDVYEEQEIVEDYLKFTELNSFLEDDKSTGVPSEQASQPERLQDTQMAPFGQGNES